MIDRIASDLGIYQFSNESSTDYKCRVLYSAVACWIKTIALDRTVVFRDTGVQGVSRRHIYDRSLSIMNTMIQMFPDTASWFEPSPDEENPVLIIRSRLINHGDLLNEGYETNLALSAIHSEQITANIETLYGKTIESNLMYSGISTVHYNDSPIHSNKILCVRDWFKCFINEIWWSNSLPDSERLQYFDPACSLRNNYSAWQEHKCNEIEGIVLARVPLANNRYNYYLFKSDGKLAHKLDPFLQDQLYQVRIMYALRSFSNNKLTTTAIRDNDCIRLHINALLPMAEQNVLSSYAWPVKSVYDRLEWIMNEYIWEYIKPYLDALDIQIEEVENG